MALGLGWASGAIRKKKTRQEKPTEISKATAPRSSAHKSLRASLSRRSAFRSGAGIQFPGQRQPPLLSNGASLALLPPRQSRETSKRISSRAFFFFFPHGSTRKRLRHGAQPWGTLSCCSWRISSRGEAARSSALSRGSPASLAPTAPVTSAPEIHGLGIHGPLSPAVDPRGPRDPLSALVNLRGPSHPPAPVVASCGSAGTETTNPNSVVTVVVPRGPRTPVDLRAPRVPC